MINNPISKTIIGEKKKNKEKRKMHRMSIKITTKTMLINTIKTKKWMIMESLQIKT